MKKSIITIMIVVTMISLIACANQAEESATTPKESAPIESAESTPVPEPTLSEEQKRILNKYNGLLDDCRNYKDWSAAVLIKDMFDAGEITEKQFFRLATISGFEDTRDLSDELWVQVKEHVDNLSNILKGQLEELNEQVMDKLYQDICTAAVQGTIYINAFDSQDKKDRIIQGVLYINQWIEDPNDDNFSLVEEIFSSEELTPGEILLLKCHLYFANGEDETRVEFLDNTSVKESADRAFNDLYNLNNTVN